jgi:hypothetical protein
MVTMANLQLRLLSSLLVPVLVPVLLHPQPLPRLLRVPIKSPKGISPLALVDWRSLQKLMQELVLSTIPMDLSIL